MLHQEPLRDAAPRVHLGKRYALESAACCIAAYVGVAEHVIVESELRLFGGSARTLV